MSGPPSTGMDAREICVTRVLLVYKTKFLSDTNWPAFVPRPDIPSWCHVLSQQRPGDGEPTLGVKARENQGLPGFARIHLHLRKFSGTL